MKITNYAIKNYQFTLIVVLMIAALGVSSMLKMPRAEDPSMNAPTYPVTVIYPGTSPKDMEELVVKPLERKISELEDIDKITTTIQDGLAVLIVEFDYNSDVDSKYQELTREVNNIRKDLPQDIYSIEVKKADPSSVNILQMEFVSENASRDLIRQHAEELKDRLEKVNGLKNVEIQGITDHIIKVDLDLAKMAYRHIPLNSVAQAIKSNLANIPGGRIIEGNKTFNIKTNTSLNSIDQIKNMIISG